ncbi:peptidylprolyl isomerase [Paracoccus yeei]|uniref:Parvulin-like PPIase n=1 Tax=Paracoccus yeei TaxID=147645 RepID=A0A1V0GTA0_9RHOB|nr:peptidylprolyl isomerase [Paracoccus yeei]ARC36919.1 peptidylprolyl isomerase [Paracoccus yeei]ATQ55444.1 peptidylprolyl isomerase [Paracoccus yeei]MBY0136761.1 peptidylprolyl isomerase [Paracoccus yeei]QEU07539.1 peptidylprolyl isomerase [Paracoccus yeei]
MLKPFLAAAALAALPLAAFAQDADTVVATVNGEAITLGQLVVMRQGLDAQTTQGLPDSALWDLMLDQMIRQTAVAQDAQPLSKRDTAALEVEKRAYLAGSVLEKVASAEPTEDELKAAYDQAFGGQNAERQEYNAAHILVKTKEEAEAIEKQLKEGADFGALAAEKSTDPTSGPNKGDLGWFQPDQMVAPFADALKAMKKGDVSQPVETQFGWHVIKLIDQRAVVPPKFDEVKDQIAVQVRRDKVQAAIEARVAESKVEKTEGLSPDLLNKTDILGN